MSAKYCTGFALKIARNLSMGHGRPRQPKAGAAGSLLGKEFWMVVNTTPPTSTESFARRSARHFLKAAGRARWRALRRSGVRQPMLLLKGMTFELSTKPVGRKLCAAEVPRANDLKPFSKEWYEREAEEERRLQRITNICKGC